MTIDPEKKKKMLSYRWAIFVVLAIAYFFVYFHRTTGGAISDTLQDFFGVGTASVALLASAYLYAYTLMQIPSGILTDKMGPRKAATIFVFLIAVGSLLSAYSATCGNFTLMIAGKFIIGIGAAVVYIPIMKVLAVWFRKNEFASMSGVLLLVGNVGGIAAATPMVIMMDSLGIQNTYIVLAIITAVIALLCWFIVRNHPSEKDLPSIEEVVSEETGEPITESTSAKIGTTEALKKTFFSGRKFWPLAIWFFFIYGTIMLWQASQAGSYYKGIMGFDATTASLMITMVGVGMVFGCPLAGILSDKVFHSRKKVVIIGTLIYTIIWAVIWLTSGMDAMYNTSIQAAINFAFGFFGGFFVVSYAQIKELYPIAMAGTSTAALNLFPFAGGAILITIAGFIVTSKTLAQYQTLWLMAFIMMVIATICAFISVEKGEKEKKAKGAEPEVAPADQN
ncbi:MAG: MFS transporter [Candidatus Methanomethylophilaceae archaeon]